MKLYSPHNLSGPGGGLVQVQVSGPDKVYSRNLSTFSFNCGRITEESWVVFPTFLWLVLFLSVRAKLTHTFNITASIFFQVLKELFDTDVNAAKKKEKEGGERQL